MYEDEILREAWRVKSQLAAEYERAPNAYWAKLRLIGQEYNKRGSKLNRPLRKPTKRARNFTNTKG